MCAADIAACERFAPLCGRAADRLSEPAAVLACGGFAAERMPPKAAEKHAGRAAPNGAKLSERKVTKAAVPPEKAAKPQEKSRSDKSCCGSNKKYRRGRRKSREAAKGFNWACAKPPLRRAESRFVEPRASRKGNGFILFACTKRTKSTPEVCEPLDSGDDSNLRSIQDFR